jgi:hypothetical protein
MSDQLELFTEDEKNSISYKACVGGTTLTGLALGRFGGIHGLVVGGAAGLAWGLLTCKYLKEPIKRKLFSHSERIHEGELSSLLNTIRSQHPALTKNQAIELLAQIRSEISSNTAQYKKMTT